MAASLSRVLFGARLNNSSVFKCFANIHLRGANYGKLPLSCSSAVRTSGYVPHRAYSFVANAPSGDFRSYRRKWDNQEEEAPPSQEEMKHLDQLSRKHRQEAMGENPTTESISFKDFPLDETLLRSLEDLGYKTPFAIQTKTLEYTLNGKDVIGRAVTGSGKTLAFAIPIVHKLSQSPSQPRSRSPRAIVIAPTRELCNQIYRSVQELNPHSRCVALYGGDSYVRQEREIQRGVDVVCATPGRLRDHLEKGSINLTNLQFLCLDEADELLNPNFREQIEDVFSNSPKTKQVLMFSATMAPEVKQIAHRYMNSPQFVDIVDELQAPKNIEHQCIKAPSSHHVPIVSKLVSQHNAERCIVFLKTKVTASRVATMLGRQGLSADAIHSDLSQSRREKILSSFRVGDLKVLCATDVAARGLDIPEVDLVVQVEPPANGVEYYIHRAGRTGRAGRKGLAVLLHTGTFDDNKIIQQISRMVEMKHVQAPEDVFAELEDRKLETSLDKMKKVTDKEREKVMPIVNKLVESGSDLNNFLASALVVLSKPSYESAAPVSNYSKSDYSSNDSEFGSASRSNFRSDRSSYRNDRSNYQDDSRSNYRSDSRSSFRRPSSSSSRFSERSNQGGRKSLFEDDFDY